MAMTNAAINDPAGASDVNHAPRHSDGNICTPKARRSPRTGSSRWNQILRPESESFDAVPSSSSVVSSPLAVVEPIVPSLSSSLLPSASEGPLGESLEDGFGLNHNAGKKPAWNKPANGASDGGLVMGAVSWPALSASTRAASKLSSESQKGLPHGYDSSELQSQKQISSNVDADSSAIANNSVPARQKSMKRNSANNSYSGGISQQSISPDSSVESLSYYSNSKDHNQRSGLATQSPTSNDYPIQQRNSFRNRNGGTHVRGDSSHHHNHVVRRDHDRGNQDWNGHGNFNGHQQRIVPRHMKPSPPTAPFIPPPSIRPFVGQVPFPELAGSVIYVDPHRGVPFVAPIAHPAMFFPAPDPHLFSKIVNQIDYYFSNDNLIRDTFLRQNMDDQGWVPIKLIAGFNKVLCLTDNLQLILDALRTSTVVEVQGDKVRRRNDWMRWTMPPSAQIPYIAGPQSLEASGSDLLTTGVQNLALENKSNYNSPKFRGDQSEALQGRSLNEFSQSPLSAVHGKGQFGDSGFDHSSSARY